MGEDERVIELIRVHLARYPEMRMMDLYRLLHQATFGPGHRITGKKEAREWLEFQMDHVTPSRTEAAAEAVHPDGEIVRVNLRHYVALGGKSKPLLEAVIHSADWVRGDTAVMAGRWRLVESLAQAGDLNAEYFPVREVLLFGRVRAHEQWPAVQHSPEYEAVYHPVYRLLTRSDAEAVYQKLGVPLQVI